MKQNRAVATFIACLLVLSASPRAEAAPGLLCAEIFSAADEASLKDGRAEKTVKSDPESRLSFLEKAMFWRPRANFQSEEFMAERARFIDLIRSGHKKEAARGAVTAVQKLALIEAVGSVSGRDVFAFETWLRNAGSTQKRELARLLNKLDFSRDPSFTRTQKTLVKLYLLSHVDPSAKGFFSLLSTPWAEDVLQLVRYRVEISVARNGVVKAMEDLGLVRSPTARERLMQKLAAYRRPLDIGWTTIKTAISFYFPLVDLRLPQVLLTARDLPQGLERRYIEKGFSAVESEVYAAYGRSAKTQLALERIERVAGVLTAPVLLYVLFDDLKSLAQMVYGFSSEPAPESDGTTSGAEGTPQSSPVDDGTLKPEERARLIESMIERHRRILIAATKPLEPETKEEREERIARINEDPSVADLRAQLNRLSGKDLLRLASE